MNVNGWVPSRRRTLSRQGPGRPHRRHRLLGVLIAAVQVAVLLSFVGTPALATTAPDPGLEIVPQPASVSSSGETYTLASGARIVVATAHAALLPVADELASILRPSTGYALPVVSTAPAFGDIVFALDSDQGLGDEGYALTVGASGVALEASAPAGAFYGVQTLRQLFSPWIESATVRPGPWIATRVQIVDQPRYEYRGVMLDIARHFEPPDAVKLLIDDASAYKVNVLHLHVSDDQGFRIAINGRPELTEIGGQFSINDDPGGFWTQAEYIDVVAYAAEHFMTVVPEVDSPGHNNAIIMSYAGPEADPILPDVNCSNRNPPVWNLTGSVGYSALCPESDNTWAIMTDIVTQLSAMSPGPYYNIGGDEVPTSLLSAARYVTFVDREAQIVKASGKAVMGWAEISQANFDDPDAPEAVAQFWNNGNPTGSGGDTARRAVAKGMKVVMSPANHTYLDMRQASGQPLGLSWACSTPCDVDDFYNWGATSPTGDLGTYIPARTASATMTVATEAGATHAFVSSVSGFKSGDTITIDTGDSLESVKLTAAGTAQQTNRSLSAAAAAGDANVKVNNVGGFVVGQPMSIDTGANREVRTVTAVGNAGAAGSGVTFEPALDLAHAQGVFVRGLGSGIDFAPALTLPHGVDAALTNPLPAVTDADILGVEGPIWSETLQTIQDVEFMVFPRLPVLAEHGWSPKTHDERSQASFVARLAPHGARWQIRGQNFYPSTLVPWRVDIAAEDQAQASRAVDGVVATVAAPGATLAQVTSSIDWGDGSTSAGMTTGTQATNKTSNSLYDISGSHTYSADGVYTVGVSVTRAGATVTSSFEIVIDTTGPEITVPGAIIVNATSPSGAVVEYLVTATDNIDPNPSLACEPASGSVFPIGTTTVSCSSSDNLDNTSEATFTVHVRSAAEQLVILREAVQGVGPGTSLNNKIAEAEAAVASGNTGAACTVLDDFRALVKAQAGKKIPAATADFLRGEAARIQAVLGC